MSTSLKDFVSSFFLLELFKGMALTGRHFLKPYITVQFPEEKTPMSPRFRGLHALRRYPNGEERCHLPSHGHHDRVRCARRRPTPYDPL